MPTRTIKLDHVPRIEGHGNIVVETEDGKVLNCQWQVPEAPRFFEAMLLGRPWDEVTPIVSRICGICSVSHSLVSLKAIEAAFGVDVSEQTVLLRKLLKHGETLQSHILHIGYLALPDLVGIGSALPLEATHKDALHTVIRLHRLGNDICTVVGGRTTHPVRVQVGGFSALPTPGELVRLLVRLEGAMGEIEEVARVLQSVADRIPAFERETEYVALASDEEYAFYDGLIGSTDTGRRPVADYESVANEYIVPWSTAKWTKHNRDSYMVGALARANISGDRLSETAKKTARELGFSTPCRNPFMNSVAQAVECVQSIEESVKIISRLLERGITREESQAQEESHVGVKAGRGVAAVEAPRGILFHDYTFDETGRCAKANCVIPTNQNHANIQGDFEAFAPVIVSQPKERIEFLLQMLVRAYDPCVSCSTH